MVRGMASKNVVVGVPAEMHEAWSAAARKAGMSLSAYVRLAVEDMRTHGDARARADALPSQRGNKRSPTVRPEDCTRRVRAGSYCRFCEAIHTRGI